MILIWSCSFLCPIYWSWVLSWEWRCSWSSTDRLCSNYIWAINNFVACLGATYIRDLMVLYLYCTSLLCMSSCAIADPSLNTLRLWWDGQHFTDDIFKCIFYKQIFSVSIKISLKLIPIKNIPALVQIMAWHHPGDKPLSEPVMVNLQMHICITQPQWVKWNCKRFWMCWIGVLNVSTLCGLVILYAILDLVQSYTVC